MKKIHTMKCCVLFLNPIRISYILLYTLKALYSQKITPDQEIHLAFRNTAFNMFSLLRKKVPWLLDQQYPRVPQFPVPRTPSGTFHRHASTTALH